MFPKSFVFFFIFSSLTGFSLFSDTKVYLTGVRPPFFLIHINPDYSLSKNDRYIYSPTGKRMAEYVVLNTSGDEVLCKYLDNGNKLSDICYVNSKMIPEKLVLQKNKTVHLKDLKKEKIVPMYIRVRGIMFVKRDKGIYFTENPVPASMIPNITYNGIDNFMKKIAAGCDPSCTVKYLTKAEIEKYSLLGGKDVMLLGVESGSHFLIYFSESKLRKNPVSEKILMRLKYRIFIPLKLIISEKG